MAVLAAAVVTATGLAVFVNPAGALAHGAATAPASRTYMCYLDGLLKGGDITPINPACVNAVAVGGKQPIWDFYGVLRSDGAGRMSGFIPDGQLCSGGNTKFAAFDVMRNDWPVTHLTAGGTFQVHYNAWAPHPGQFRLYVTKAGFDPTAELGWDDLESQPFDTWNETVPNGNGEYYWNATLPTGLTGRHIIYSVWARTDSSETFYGCSDVVFDGGTGQVTGVGDPGTGATSAPTSAAPTSAVVTSRAPVTTAGPTTRAPVTTAAPTTRAPVTTAGPTSRAPVTTGVVTSVNPIGCQATYKSVGQWTGGFQGEVTIKNNGASPTSSWRATVTFANGQTLSQVWNGTGTTSGSTTTVTNVSWNGSLGVGASTSFGFLGSWNGTNDAPKVSCTLA
ncbi:lytic polysaccharide monooxygenase [Luedemannella flava]|uniref:Lytic polysaccharide monooxygenase n=1 Tax=Luedemannella flava TaxID=349316 RepID=A0ABP4YK09_9ACTN